MRGLFNLCLPHSFASALEGQKRVDIDVNYQFRFAPVGRDGRGGGERERGFFESRHRNIAGTDGSRDRYITTLPIAADYVRYEELDASCNIEGDKIICLMKKSINKFIIALFTVFSLGQVTEMVGPC
ncbi:hypothetical protein GWI33_017714 [Rhynchophorus ferrugineus]|uniref:Uncharacterized protein n=1 Tax=Rhynchophorus ferrugineus TaxID=354439 RepID=A0A834HY27_RHYFE|nr:hypothetical protein GWI33_017714 [Rhynchophorus ferrugineus]